MKETVRVELGARSYEILVGSGLIGDAGRHIAPVLRRDRVVVVTDRTVAGLYLDTLTDALSAAGIASDPIVLPPGEATKDFAELGRLIEAILDTRPERRSTVVALGGGVVGDIAGVAASLVLRGIDYIQVPTTLLAQVDSAVGGKTAVNTRHGKNLIGAFYQPRLVLADTATLDTLARRQVVAGYAEVVKYGLIGDAAFFAWLEAHGREVISGDGAARRRAVVTSCAAKAAVVAEDERETGRRALLNLGHTFGHALEAATGYGDRLLHGEAVAIGIALAFDLSADLGLCRREDAARVRRHLADVGLPTSVAGLATDGWSAERLLAYMRQDKKVAGGKLTLVLARGIGEAFTTTDVEAASVERLLRSALAA